MWSDTMDLNDARMAARVKRLENFHRSKLGWVSGLLLLGFYHSHTSPIQNRMLGTGMVYLLLPIDGYL